MIIGIVAAASFYYPAQASSNSPAAPSLSAAARPRFALSSIIAPLRHSLLRREVFSATVATEGGVVDRIVGHPHVQSMHQVHEMAGSRPDWRIWPVWWHSIHSKSILGSERARSDQRLASARLGLALMVTGRQPGLPRKFHLQRVSLSGRAREARTFKLCGGRSTIRIF
jgi:hypothetical protein